MSKRKILVIVLAAIIALGVAICLYRENRSINSDNIQTIEEYNEEKIEEAQKKDTINVLEDENKQSETSSTSKKTTTKTNINKPFAKPIQTTPPELEKGTLKGSIGSTKKDDTGLININLPKEDVSTKVVDVQREYKSKNDNKFIFK